jgi:hypothetical protein
MEKYSNETDVYLLIPKDEFAKKLKETINVGENLLNAVVDENYLFLKFKDDFYNWHIFNFKFLESSFNIARNKYFLEYEYKVIHYPSSAPPALNLSRQVEVQNIKSKVIKYLDGLKSIEKQIVFMEVRN